MELQQWQSNLYKEQASINKRINNLHIFMHSPEYDTLDNKHKKLLKKQNKVMMKYNEILCKRILTFSDNAEG